MARPRSKTETGTKESPTTRIFIWRSGQGSGIHPAWLQIHGVPGARLHDHLEHRLRVEVVEADRLADSPLHHDLGPEVGEVTLGCVGLGRRRPHDGYVVKALAMGVEPFLIYAGSLVGLQQLDQDRTDMGLGANHREVGRLAVQVCVVKGRRLVLVHVPRPPAERPVVALERLVDVPDHDGDLTDGETTVRNRRVLRRLAMTVTVARHYDLPTKLLSG